MSTDMNPKTHGIHHITAIAGDPQKNVDFYVGILGLRMVKKTVNFDDLYTYHLYYGDENGSPGTIMTFFPWTSKARHGRVGVGQLTVTSFSIPAGAMGYWIDRLNKYNIDFSGPGSRFEEEVLTFHDPDGIELELDCSATESRAGWDNGQIPFANSIRGFYHITLSEEGYERTAGLMETHLGFHKVNESGNRLRLASGERGPGTFVDILSLPDAQPGIMGVGAVHHVAWRISDANSQLDIRDYLLQVGYEVTPVMDRFYFHSIYFREPGGVLFEIATDPPGFTVDEEIEKLGTDLKLPDWLEEKRSVIEENLLPITLQGKR